MHLDGERYFESVVHKHDPMTQPRLAPCMADLEFNMLTISQPRPRVINIVILSELVRDEKKNSDWFSVHY